MIEACFKAFARALRVAVSVDPEESGVPSTKGTLESRGAADAMTTRIAILDYGMGNLRSVEKALEHVGASATITADAGRGARRRRRRSCPGSAPSRRRWSGSASAASTS